VRSRLEPGAKGTKGLVREFGDSLVCVRYRYDEVRGKRLKTAEIVVAEAQWKPRPTRVVFVDLKSWETALRAGVLGAGGRWDRRKALWKLPYDRAVRLGLSHRIRSEATPEKLQILETEKLQPVEASPIKPRKSF
jgi:hypothetical protein